ncbi:MAG TPA: hypothetical protein VFY13_10615, partial [Luteolibacter sp.]|nr:hypothetical protein [Luteolibacter sp.]
MFSMRIQRLALICVATYGLALGAEPTFWDWRQEGGIRHVVRADAPPMVLCMQGRKVVMECKVDAAAGLEYSARFFNVVDPQSRDKAIFKGGANSLPGLTLDGQALTLPPVEAVVFDGRLILHYRAQQGVSLQRCVHPSMDRALVIEEWTLHNHSKSAIRVEVARGETSAKAGAHVLVEWECPAVAAVELAAGQTLSFHSAALARRADQKPTGFSLEAQRAARIAVAQRAWQGPGRLEVPDEAMVAAWNLQKLHVLETPMDTCKGVITHNGSLTYTPGVWANDPVEYSSPLFPFFGDALLNESAMNMYRIWLTHCREHGIQPFPGSFEHEKLALVQRDRGDDAMVLYGLSKFLLFQGDRKAAEELWPLIEFSVTSIEGHMTPEGIVASKTDEMEGRYPTGDANLSTSSLAYGGYRHAAHLARALGKADLGKLYDERATKLAAAIDAYFAAEIEGFPTYRYYQGNTTLRGWILLPLAMDLWGRKQGTLDAMLSDKLWPARHRGGDILAESTRETEWGRETYYALRVLFKAGLADQAADLTHKVVVAQIFGPRGPYPDEDAIDMLCPGSLYPRVFTEGVFGIAPTGLDSFELQPQLPKAWPKMALRELRICGASWDIEVERDGDAQKVRVTRDGVRVLDERGPATKRYAVG